MRSSCLYSLLDIVTNDFTTKMIVTLVRGCNAVLYHDSEPRSAASQGDAVDGDVG